MIAQMAIPSRVSHGPWKAPHFTDCPACYVWAGCAEYYRTITPNEQT